MKPVRVVELFAGVGGFRIGLERASDRYRVVWSNQWEPGVKKQVASDIYVRHFGGEGHVNADIATVAAADIPAHDLLVGGFPCQDYSVARMLKQAEGLAGKKGVLWWEIHRIIKHRKPAHLLLENVDRLLKSPATQRGRDFAVMLAGLADLGYVVEWRVINAADHGMPQRRRRVFILGHRVGSPMGARLKRTRDPEAWITEGGIFARAFPAQATGALSTFDLTGDLADITERFNTARSGAASPFANAGILVGRRVHTVAVAPRTIGPSVTLGDILLPPEQVPAAFYIDPAQVDAWKYLKGGKKEVRTTAGFSYKYSEGPMAFPDPLDKPARTIVTGEGGSAPSRFKHVVRTPDGRLRRLTPVELERLNMFPDDHTAGATDAKRAFLMGNALVTGIVERVGKVLEGEV
ncbi:MAG: DNA (cytosine-5-)-methyltransferase [Flavobacteriales bacterium]|jgi:DNA (cytosine-5)-methyltransferase 1|nr:DNA (cytosine-5-)-methyltransferase [Flavobacteriales bacterium]